MKTKQSAVFDISGSNLDEVRSEVESVLAVELIAHESDYHGGDYFKGTLRGVSLVLKSNFLEDDGDLTEAEFPDAAFLLYVNGAQAAVDGLRDVLLARGAKQLRATSW
jgi:hypothetical protein